MPYGLCHSLSRLYQTRPDCDYNNNYSDDYDNPNDYYDGDDYIDYDNDNYDDNGGQ